MAETQDPASAPSGARTSGSAPPPGSPAAESGAGDPRPEPALALRISLYYAATFGLVGVTMPFFPVWLESRGLGAAEIGLLLSCTMWVRVFSNPAMTSLADRLGERRRLMILLALGGTLAALLFPLVRGFWPVLAVAALHTMLQGPVMPLGENLVLLAIRARGLDYGRLRLWGSIAFIATSIGAGALLAGRPDSLIMGLIVGLLALIVLATLALPEMRPPSDRPRALRPVRVLLTNGVFLLFVLTASLNSASHSVLLGFATIHWRAAGLADETIGLLWAAGVVAEIALFAGSRIALRLGTIGLFALGAAAGMLRWIGTAVTTEIWALAFFQALHALTFGATHLAAMNFIGRAVPAHYSATAQGLYSSLSTGVVVGLTMMASGALYAALAGHAFLVMALLSLGSLLAALALGRVWRDGVEIG